MHRNISMMIAILLSLFFCLNIFANPRPEKELPVVKITSPAGGQSSNRSVTVAGTISDATITRAWIVINSSANMFDVAQGNFSYPVVLSPGENVLQIIVENEAGIGKDTVVIYSIVPKRDVKVVMTWDTQTDIDLHVIDPNDEETFYSSKESKIGGQLDHDDTDGFGPETFMLSNSIEGKYIVKAKYYGGAAGQTRIKVTVVLFEGTPKESRRDYYRLVTVQGEFAEVCSFFVGR